VEGGWNPVGATLAGCSVSDEGMKAVDQIVVHHDPSERCIIIFHHVHCKSSKYVRILPGSVTHPRLHV